MDTKNLAEKVINPDYQKLYGIYKKLPGILAIIIMSLVFIWSIVDVSVFVESYYRKTYYGVMYLESAFLAMFIWWVIGAVVAASTWFFSALSVSATVARTDAVIELNNKTPNKE